MQRFSSVAAAVWMVVTTAATGDPSSGHAMSAAGSAAPGAPTSDKPSSSAATVQAPAAATPLPTWRSGHGPAGCLKTGNGYLRARIRGALNADVDFHDAELECEGEARPDGSGIRVSFAGPLHSDGRRLRMVFGVGSAKEGRSGRELPTNLTVILEGEKRLFATRGEDKCTVDELQQERLGALGGPSRSYRVVARGFCATPASAVSGNERILVSSFDFAGTVTFEDEPTDSAQGRKTKEKS
jgi:hypothetical protein